MDSIQVCRCCLAVGLHKDLNSPYTWLESKEIYSDMLLECFNIVLSTEKTCNMICDTCIGSLRSSLFFKRQVLKAEQDFIKWIREKVETDDPTEVKEELKMESDGDESDNYFLCDAVKRSSASMKHESKDTNRRVKSHKRETKDLDSLESIDLQIDVKVEPKPETNEEDSDDYFLSDTINETTQDNISKEHLKRRVKKKKTEGGDWQTTKIKTIVNRLTGSVTDTCDITDIKLNKSIRKNKNRKLKISSQNDRRINLTWTSRGNSEKAKHRENLQTILQHCNATPFKNKSLLGYTCGYCEQTYQDPIDLRSHTKEKHQNERLEFKSNFDMTEYNVKLDVTDLACTLCDQNMNNLIDFKSHLVTYHNKVLHTDIKDHIQQFKLRKGDVYDCAMCSSTYETFKMLKQHMNKHYSNYTCNKCHTSFATKRSLCAHRTTHQEGSFKCDHCDKIFSSRAKKLYHEKTKHLGERNISNCPYCDQPFRSYYQRNQHLVKVHNIESQYKCNVCSKSYILKSLLMCHIKKNHLMERNCQCSECGFKFFSKKALKAHMVKHTGKKIYACEVCHKAYARKYTLREHMRIHNNDRRFKCDVCGVSFVQKCSLKSHLLSNHGISMAASDITSSKPQKFDVV